MPRIIYDCATVGGCGKKDVDLLDTDDDLFCGNCGGEAAPRGGPSDMDLFRLAASISKGGA